MVRRFVTFEGGCGRVPKGTCPTQLQMQHRTTGIQASIVILPFKARGTINYLQPLLHRSKSPASTPS